MFVCILLVGTVSALDITYTKSYDELTQTITIKSFPLIGRDITTIQLLTPLNLKVGAGYGKVAELEIELFDDTYTDAFEKMDFYNAIDMEEINRQFDYKYLTTELVDVNDYGEVCNTLINLTKVCSYEITGIHQEEREVWLDLDIKVLTKGKVTIGIFTYVQIDDYVEWIPTLFGKEIDEWATWTRDLNVNIVSYWALEETTGDVIDGVGNFPASTTAERGVTGIIGNAFDFDSEYVETNDIFSITGADARTVSMWVYLNTLSAGEKYFMFMGTASNSRSFGFRVSSPSAGDWGFLGYNNDYDTGVDLSTGNWYHLVATYSGTVIRTYANGEETPTSNQSKSLNTGASDFVFGNDDDPHSGNFDGIIDEVGVWSRVLTPAEVVQLYNGSSGIIYIGDFGEPKVSLNTPVNTSNFTTNTINFGGVVTDDINLINVSLIINDVYNETNTSGINNSNYTFTKTLADEDYTWTYEACDNASQCTNATPRSFSIDTTNPEVVILTPSTIIDYHVLNTNITFNWSANDSNIGACVYNYEGINYTVTCSDNTTNINITNSINRTITFYVNDTFGHINVTSRTWNYNVFENSRTLNTLSYQTQSETLSINITANSTLAAVTLDYNGTDYFTIKSASVYSSTFDIPFIFGNKSIRWKFTYAGGTIYSDYSYQYINLTQLGICNATLIVPYINFTFVDEETALNINATMDTSTWEYWLGDGTVTKSLIFSNTTLNDNYAFCLSASNDTMYNTRSIQYASPGYPQRKYDASSDLTNSSLNQVLYLLSSVDGIYSTIQVVDQDGDKVGGLEVTVERQFAGVWTVVGQETTDDAGLVTFWINPDYDHRFTFAGDDCTGLTVTIRPTQTQYTQQLQCGVSADIYVSQIEGIKYSRTPATGIIQAGTYNFSYQLVSSKDNIVNMSFQLVNASDGTVLNSSWSICNVGGCTIYVMHTVDLGNDIKGKYYLDVGNGSFLLEGDARWRCIDIPTAGKAGIGTFIRDMKYVIDEWGDDSDTADFNRLVIVFFFMCLGISVLNYNLGSDTSNPGAFLIIMTFVILMGSIVGGTTGQGFFYFNNLTGTTFINNYILLGFTLIITISYFLNVNRQAQR